MGHWLTPDTPPEKRFYFRTLQIPATSEFLGLVSGALIELAQSHNYEEAGELTAQETADIFLAMLQPFWVNNNEPPEWETPDDLDGQPAQNWYDELADWIIAGFLAVTFTPQAAITYTATVPKLRIAFRTGNIGALFKVLINGVEVWTGDSYAPITDLIDHVFDMSAETEPYTVRIEHNGVGENVVGGEAKLEVIRGEAVASMVATILRADPTGCGIQWSTDDGGTWNTVDLATCITGLANDAITQAIEDGVIQRGGTQQGPATAPEANTCVSYHVLLPGHDLWNSPCVVNAGDTIQVTNWRGQWNDGFLNGLLAWECGDGGVVFLGDCTEPDSADPADPLQTAAHMQIIGHNSIEYFDPLTIYTVPAGIANEHFVLQPNDSDLLDNSGLVSFDVEICANNGWSMEWDFTTGEHGFSPAFFSGQYRAVYSAGVGWTQGADGYTMVGRATEIAGSHILGGYIYTTSQPDNSRAWIGGNEWNHQQFEGLATYPATVVDGLYRNQCNVDIENADGVFISADTSQFGCTIVKLELHGVGAPPYEA